MARTPPGLSIRKLEWPRNVMVMVSDTAAARITRGVAWATGVQPASARRGTRTSTLSTQARNIHIARLPFQHSPLEADHRTMSYDKPFASLKVIDVSQGVA